MRQGRSRRGTRLLLTTGGTLAVLLATGTVPGTHAQAVTSLPGFATPVASGIQGYGFEQNMRIDPSSGAIYTSAPDSLSSATSWIWHSVDGGETFKWIPAAAQPQGKPFSPVTPTCWGGGDSELAVDSAGHLYFNDLTLANFSTARSDDKGKSFTSSCTGVPAAGVDRQWYATHGDPTNGGVMALAYDRILQTNPAICNGFTTPANADNILTLNLSPATPLPGSTAGVEFGPSQTISCDEGIMGNNEMFDYGAGTGNGLKVYVVHDNAALNSVSMARCDVVGISVTNPTGLTNCQDKLINQVAGTVVGGSFPTMAVDSAGNVYAVWERAPGAQGAITGNTSLVFAKSTDRGNTWTTSALPTPGLANNVFAWIAGGDTGRLDVAWYGTSANFQGTAGPDSTVGNWGLYVTQTLNSGTSWSVPVLASEHFIHHGTIQTVMGGQTGDRTLGDYIQIRIGPKGEANISYSDSNNIDEGNTPQATFVRQNSGPSVLAAAPTVTGVPAASTTNSVADPSGDATYDSAGNVSNNIPNLDITQAQMSMPDSTHYQIKMTIADLTSLATTADSAPGGTVNLWQMQWHVPSTTDVNGGKLFHAYMESQGGQAPTCWDGENAAQGNGGGILLTYPGAHQVTGAGCSYTATKPGTITITVPTADVTEPGAIDNVLYSATANTQVLALPPDQPQFQPVLGVGGEPFSLVDVAPAFDFNPANATTPPVTVSETPWAAAVVLAGMAGLFTVTLQRRRRGAA